MSKSWKRTETWIALIVAAVGLLLEKDRLNLDEEVQKYVPEFPQKQSRVTLRQLMGHLAGVRNDGGDEGRSASRRDSRSDSWSIALRWSLDCAL